MSDTILITGARAPVAQDLARACRAAGYDVHLADSAPAYAAHALRPRFPVHRLPSPRHAFGAFREAMRSVLQTIGARMIVPTCEEVFWLAEAAARDGYSDRLFAPPPTLLRTLHSKALFPAFAAELGIAVPKTQVLAEPVDPSGLALDELVLKPEYSRFATHTVVAPTNEQIARIRPSPERRWVLQQRIRGHEYCSWAAARNGRITAFAAYCPRRRQGQAAAFQFEAVTVPALRKIAERIAGAVDMTGHLSFDVIVDESGTAYPIECNPRAVSGLHLFDACPGLARAILTGEPVPEPPQGRMRHLGPAMVLLGLPQALRHQCLNEWRADWKASRDVIDREGNTFLTLGCLADAAGFALKALQSAQSPAGATTADIEWDGEVIP